MLVMMDNALVYSEEREGEKKATIDEMALVVQIYVSYIVYPFTFHLRSTVQYSTYIG
jgi:hypothetical protein